MERSTIAQQLVTHAHKALLGAVEAPSTHGRLLDRSNSQRASLALPGAHNAPSLPYAGLLNTPERNRFAVT